MISPSRMRAGTVRPPPARFSGSRWKIGQWARSSKAKPAHCKAHRAFSQ